MNKISFSPEKLQDHYEAIVIGSGYGGSIAASRLARAGKKVALLERGKEMLPGEYPDTLLESVQQMQVHTAKGHTGSATGLFDFHVHPDISVLVGCGLGGTSLINANVSIDPEKRVFEDARWPKQLRDEFHAEDSELSKGYQRARDMLKPNPLPQSQKLAKLTALETSANANGEKFYRTDINVNFTVDGPNHVGQEQKPCSMCGNCCSGCNYQAKNTTLMNYLPDAAGHGAEIFTEISVSHLERKEGKWLVYYSIANTGAQLFNAALLCVSADMVIVSAGTLGSTEIMLRSKAKGLPISNRTGEEFSGNGDVLGFGYNTAHEVDGVGAPAQRLFPNHPAGPTITGIIDLRNQEVLEDGMIIEDAAIPGCLASILPAALAAENRLVGVNEEQSSDETIIRDIEHEARIAESLLRGAYHGAINHTQTYLMMSHDGEAGKLSLENDKLSINWKGVGSEEIFKKADAQLRKETKALSGRYIKNPVWIKPMNNELVTVHPLGGCCMGESIESGVVNHKGQVFTDIEASGVFDSLYITDGSVVPRSLGVNPLITISAISERCVALMAKDNKWNIDYTFKDLSKKLEAINPPETVGVEFTETMRGFFTPGALDYQPGYDSGKQSDNSFSFTLTIRTDDVYSMIENPPHKATMSGVVTAPSLSPAPLTATEGEFHLFAKDPNDTDTLLMQYAMKLTSQEGKTWYMTGFKFVHHKKAFDQWAETSTLYITIYEGGDVNAPVLGKGILHILPSDFAKQMRTMKAVNAADPVKALEAMTAFGNFFSKSLFEVYGGIAAPLDWFDEKRPLRKKRELRTPEPEIFPFTTEDGLDLRLTRYKAGNKGPVMLVHPFNGGGVTYSIDTMDTNILEYLCANGYDVWLLDYRISVLLPSSKEQWTADQIAQYDHPAAVKKMLEVTGANGVDVIAHCLGSISMFMALLNGMEGVRSLLSMQIATHFTPALQVHWKTALHVPEVLHALGVNDMTAHANKQEGWVKHLYDKFLTVYGDAVSGWCTNPVCHRMAFMYGPLYEHINLDEHTHEALIEMVGIANMTTFHHLAEMIRHGQLINVDGADVYMEHGERLAIPITFIHGTANKVFEPKSTEDTFNWLRSINDPGLYERHLIEGYGHNDCIIGKNAINDVFPFVLAHLEKVNTPAYA